MPRVDLDSIPMNNNTGYPAPYAKDVEQRWCRRLAPIVGIEDFGANHVVLKPGAWSSQRHWHEEEDELVVMLSGEAVMIDDNGRTLMRAGDIAVFPKNDGNGHHFINESDVDCIFLAIGRKPAGRCHYSDIDMLFTPDRNYTRKDGSLC